MPLPIPHINDGHDKRLLLLYLNLTPVERGKLEPFDLPVSNLIFYMIGAGFRPMWIGDGVDQERTVRLITNHHDRSVLFEIASAEILTLSSTDLLERLHAQLSKR